jgi:hypothetical protein
MWRASVFLALAACSMIPLKKDRGSSSSSSAPAAPSENVLHWEKGTPIETLPGFRAFATSQPSPVPQGIDARCGAPATAHALTAEIHTESPGVETVYATTHGIVAVSQGQVVASSEPPADCNGLASEIVVAHAGFWSRNVAFPQNENRLVIVERVGTQLRQRLFTHWPKGRLTESFSGVIEDSATPGVKRTMSLGNDGEELFTEDAAFHWESQAARFIPGRKMNARQRNSF